MRSSPIPVPPVRAVHRSSDGVVCALQVILIALPITFPPGSVGQRVLGLIVCFFTSLAYALCSPYEDGCDNILSLVCQIQVMGELEVVLSSAPLPSPSLTFPRLLSPSQIFLTLLASLAMDMVTEEGLMMIDYIMVVFLFVPPGLAFIFESGAPLLPLPDSTHSSKC